MTKLCIHNVTISLDGFGAEPDQSLDDPLGRGGVALHDWLVRTRTSETCSAKAPARPASTTTS